MTRKVRPDRAPRSSIRCRKCGVVFDRVADTSALIHAAREELQCGIGMTTRGRAHRLLGTALQRLAGVCEPCGASAHDRA